LVRVCCQAQQSAHWPQTQQAGLAAIALLSTGALILRSAAVMAVSSFTMLSSLSAICLSSSILHKTILCFDVVIGTTTLAAALLHMHGAESYPQAAASSELV